MNGKTSSHQMLGLILIVLMQVGCGGILPGLTAHVPGIDEPVTVEGVEVQLSSATKQDSYEIGTQQFSTDSSETTILVIEAAVKAKEADVPTEWNVSIVDNNSGEVSRPQVTSWETIRDGPTEVIWIFVVQQTANSLTLQLPEGLAIPLDSLLLRSAPTAESGDGSTSNWNNLSIMA